MVVLIGVVGGGVVVGLHIGGGGGSLLHLAQDLGVQRRRAHLVADLTPAPLPVLPVSLHRVCVILHHDLQSHRLGLGGGRGRGGSITQMICSTRTVVEGSFVPTALPFTLKSL